MGAGTDPGDAAATEAAPAEQWRPLLRHPAEGPRGQAAHYHPHPRPEQSSTAATASSTEQGPSGPEGDPGPNAHEDRPATATGMEPELFTGLKKVQGNT